MKDIDKRPIGYVIGQYPCLTESFVRNEIELLTTDFKVIIFALSGDMRATNLIPPDQQVVRLPGLWSPNMIMSHLRLLAHRPYRYFITLYYAIRFNSFKSFYKSVYFSLLVQRYGICHLHAHFANQPTEVAMLMSITTKKEFSFSAHARDIYADWRLFEQKARRSLFFTVCSKYGCEYIQNRFIHNSNITKKMNLIRHGIRLDQWPFKERKSTKSIKILAIGRLVEKKGFRYLIEAVAELEDTLSDMNCVIIGDGPLKHELQMLCVELKINHIVSFAGFQSQDSIRQILSEATVLVQPCVYGTDGDRDSIPNVILEAMASGIPVVSTRVAGITEILNQHNSILTEPAQASPIVQAICELSVNRELARSIAIEARKTIEDHSAEIYIEELKKLFRNVPAIQSK